MTAMRIAGPLAQNGDADAQMLSGIIFLNGAAAGQEKNGETAGLMWLYKSSRQQNAEAQAVYAATLMSNGTPAKTAYDEIKLASSAGAPAGLFLLADVYLKGTFKENGPQPEDIEEGERLLLLAAQGGSPTAQLAEARRQQTAHKDLVEAYQWALLASKSPLVDKFADPMHSLSTAWSPEQRADAQKLLKELKSRMKPAQIKDAESRAAKTP
jgi:TPR repeat protein